MHVEPRKHFLISRNSEASASEFLKSLQEVNYDSLDMIVITTCLQRVKLKLHILPCQVFQYYYVGRNDRTRISLQNNLTEL